MAKWDKLLSVVLEAIEQGKTPEQIADQVGVKKTALSQQVAIWRKAGIEIPNMKSLADGSVREKVIDGICYLYQKISGKWISIGRKDGQTHVRRVLSADQIERKRKKAALMEKKERDRDEARRLREQHSIEMGQQRKEREQARVMKAAKTPEKRLPDKVIDPNQYKYVTVCRGTTIQVPKNVPDDIAVENWFRKREELKYKWIAIRKQ